MSPEAAQYVSPMPPIGFPVRWYEHGTTSDRVWPATVQDRTDRGHITLSVARHNGFPATKRTVFHIGDPRLQTQDFASRNQNGAWDYLPGLVSDERLPSVVNVPGGDLEADVAALRAEVKTLRAQLLGDPAEDDIEDRIFKAAALHPGNSRKVAEVVGCPIQKVTGVLSRLKSRGEPQPQPQPQRQELPV